MPLIQNKGKARKSEVNFPQGRVEGDFAYECVNFSHLSSVYRELFKTFPVLSFMQIKCASLSLSIFMIIQCE